MPDLRQDKEIYFSVALALVQTHVVMLAHPHPDLCEA